MPIAGSPTNRLSGWTMPTNSETPDCLRSKAIRCSKICTKIRDTANFLIRCDCRPRGPPGPFRESCMYRSPADGQGDDLLAVGRPHDAMLESLFVRQRRTIAQEYRSTPNS